MQDNPQTEDGASLRVAVIGAGIAGLAAASALQEHGHRVRVFEKSRGPGGRSATRRVDHLHFDHGAAYFTASEPAFRDAVSGWRACGTIDAWTPETARVVQGALRPATDRRERFVAVPGMSALGRHLGAGMSIHPGVRVAPPRRVAQRWLAPGQRDMPAHETRK